MALSGTLDSFALPDVLRLLASTTKSGRLRVSGDRGSGSVWVLDGEIVDTELTAGAAVESTPADVLFGLLRFETGSFTFEADATAPEPSAPEAIEPVLAAAEAMIREWEEISDVVPSPHVMVTLAPEPGGGDVMIDAPRWRCIAAVGGGATVASIGQALGQNELAACRSIKELVELGLLEIGDAVVDASTVSDHLPDHRDTHEPEWSAEHHETREQEWSTEPSPGLDDAPRFADTSASADESGEPQPLREPEHSEPAAELASAFGLEASAHIDTDGEIPEGIPAGLIDGGGPGQIEGRVTTAPGLAGLDSGVDPLLDRPLLGGPSANDPFADHDDTGTENFLTSPSADDAPVDEGVGALFGAATAEESDGSDLDPAEMARQLANLSPKAAKAVAAAAKASTDAEREAALAAVEAEDDSVNRGLLLKFLGSVDT